jgi:hypothetical protein
MPERILTVEWRGLHGGACCSCHRLGWGWRVIGLDSSSDDGHGGAAARTEHRRTGFKQELDWSESQDHLQQADQAFAVGVKEAEVSGAPESLGQDMLQDQPQEVCAGQGAALHLSGFCVAITEGHLAVVAGQNIRFADDAPVA